MKRESATRITDSNEAMMIKKISIERLEQLMTVLSASFLVVLYQQGDVRAATMDDYTSIPPFVSMGADPNVLLNLSVETPMQGAAYNDQADDENDDGDYTDDGECGGRVSYTYTITTSTGGGGGWGGKGGGTKTTSYTVSNLGSCYSSDQEYLGYFDPDKLYKYDSSNTYFYPVGDAASDHSSTGTSYAGEAYSGNFMNWATMTAIDEFRWALTGGWRVTDTTDETVLKRAYHYQNSYFPTKIITSSLNVEPSTVTPFDEDQLFIYNYTGYTISMGPNQTTDLDLSGAVIKIKVCDSDVTLEDDCVAYTDDDDNTYYKPEGLMQNHATSMRFAAMSYSTDGSRDRDGGVLRTNMKYIGPTLPDGTSNPVAEYGTDGIMIDNPDGSTVVDNSGVMNYVNKFGQNGYKSKDPVGELFYECVNYFKDRGPTADYYSKASANYPNGLSHTSGGVYYDDDFPIVTDWEDPITDWCQNNYIIGINDANPWLDKKLPGTAYTKAVSDSLGTSSDITYGYDYGEPSNADTDYSVTDWTNTVGDLQGLTGTAPEENVGCVISSGSVVSCNWNASGSKTITGLGEVFGTYPYATKYNSYYVAGLAYYAHTQDIRSDLTGRQTITTFMIDTQEYSTTPLTGEMNMLWLTGKFGGFNESDYKDTNGDGNSYEPDLDSEWDEDGDGYPDNYVLATNPDKLVEGLTTAFDQVSDTTSSATAASVISGSKTGDGATYQTVFFPEYDDDSGNTINWVGSLHALFVDSDGNMREDTNQNMILDDDDYVVEFETDSDDSVTINKYSLSEGVAEVTAITVPSAASLSSGTYFLLNTVDYDYYVWFNKDDAGSDPAPDDDKIGIEIDISTGDSADDIASTLADELDDYSVFDASASSDTVTVTNATVGEVDDADAGTSAVTVSVDTQGEGETSTLAFTGDSDDINYMWTSDEWLDGISDDDITEQRTYTSTAQKRYIFTFVDEDEDMVCESGEQQDFTATSLPSTSDLTDDSTIYPYIPLTADSTALPDDITSSNRTEFLKTQTQRVINYIRGEDQDSVDLSDGTELDAFRSRQIDADGDGTLDTTWRLGDIVDSTPSVVSAPAEEFNTIYSDTTYATFLKQYKHRRTVIYTGANDGMLHAFNGGFYDDSQDVYPTNSDGSVGDGEDDVQFLQQPEDSDGTVISGYTKYTIGQELWAYVPYNLLPHLYWLTETGYDSDEHVYYSDLKPRTFDAKIFDDDTDHPGGWGTVLVAGMRLGGGEISVDMDRTDGDLTSADRTMTSAYVIMDITNPEEAPKVLGELTFPHLGYTTCYPAVMSIKDKDDATQNDWYLVFGSGPAGSDGSPEALDDSSSSNALSDFVSNQKARLYVIDLNALAEDGEVKVVTNTNGLQAVSDIDEDDGYAYQTFDDDNNAFINAPYTVDFDLDYKTDTVYFGTESYDSSLNDGEQWGGKLRRIVVDDNADPTSWDGDSVLINLEHDDDNTTGIYAPISAKPAVGADDDDNEWVYFGTGRYFIRSDSDIDDQQYFFGIKEPLDDNDDKTYGEVSLSDLFESTDITVNSSTSLVSGGGFGTDITWSSFVTATKSYGGWYYAFPDALERSVGKATLASGLLAFTSYIPSTDDCTYEGSSYLYALYYLTGTAYATSYFTDSDSLASTTNVVRVSLGSGLVATPTLHVSDDGTITVYTQGSNGAVITNKTDTDADSTSHFSGWEYQ